MRINRYDEIKIREMSEKMGISKETIAEAIESQYLFIRKKTSELELKKDLTKEEFEKEKTNFNIPCLCKLYASYYIYGKINKLNGEKSNKK